MAADFLEVFNKFKNMAKHLTFFFCSNFMNPSIVRDFHFVQGADRDFHLKYVGDVQVFFSEVVQGLFRGCSGVVQGASRGGQVFSFEVWGGVQGRGCSRGADREPLRIPPLHGCVELTILNFGVV